MVKTDPVTLGTWCYKKIPSIKFIFVINSSLFCMHKLEAPYPPDTNVSSLSLLRLGFCALKDGISFRQSYHNSWQSEIKYTMIMICTFYSKAFMQDVAVINHWLYVCVCCTVFDLCLNCSK